MREIFMGKSYKETQVHNVEYTLPFCWCNTHGMRANSKRTNTYDEDELKNGRGIANIFKIKTIQMMSHKKACKKMEFAFVDIFLYASRVCDGSKG